MQVTFSAYKHPLSFVIVVHNCRIKEGQLHELFGPLYGPDKFEVILIPNSKGQQRYHQYEADRWGPEQRTKMTRLWPQATACFSLTTAIVPTATMGNSAQMEMIYGACGNRRDRAILCPDSLSKIIAGKRVVYPRAWQETRQHLPEFVKGMLKTHANRRATRYVPKTER